MEKLKIWVEEEKKYGHKVLSWHEGQIGLPCKKEFWLVRDP